MTPLTDTDIETAEDMAFSREDAALQREAARKQQQQQHGT
jgi:hypothetical protein